MIENKKNKKKNIFKNTLSEISKNKYSLIFSKLSKTYTTLKKTIFTQIHKLKLKKIKTLYYKKSFLTLVNLNQEKNISYQNFVKKPKFKILKNLRQNKFLIIIKNLKLNQINSDNFIFYLYLVIGILLSLTTFSLFTMRIISDNKSLEKEIEASLKKKSKIPEISLKLKKLRALGKSISLDNEFILNIIGEQKEPTTLLYIVNNIAIKNNIDIVELEPLKKIYFKEKPNIQIKNNGSSIGTPPSVVGPPPPPVPNNQIISPDSGLSGESDKNFLLTRKLERQIYNLKFRGYFVDSMQFIKDLELLENIVIFEDLKLKRLQDYDKNSKSKILFESSLSVFGRSISNELSKN